MPPHSPNTLKIILKCLSECLFLLFWFCFFGMSSLLKNISIWYSRSIVFGDFCSFFSSFFSLLPLLWSNWSRVCSHLPYHWTAFGKKLVVILVIEQFFCFLLWTLFFPPSFSTFFGGVDLHPFLKIVFVAPIQEEIIFRLILFSVLKYQVKDDHSCIFICGVTFGMLHLLNLVGKNFLYVGLQVVGGTVFGLVLSALFCHSGSILSCIVVHSLNNFFSYLLFPKNQIQKVQMETVSQLSDKQTTFFLLLSLCSLSLHLFLSHKIFSQPQNYLTELKTATKLPDKVKQPENFSAKNKTKQTKIEGGRSKKTECKISKKKCFLR